MFEGKVDDCLEAVNQWNIERDIVTKHL